MPYVPKNARIARPAEAKTNKHYDQLTAVKLGHWPIVLTACREHRLPVPPQVWRDLLPHVG